MNGARPTRQGDRGTFLLLMGVLLMIGGALGFLLAGDIVQWLPEDWERSRPSMLFRLAGAAGGAATLMVAGAKGWKGLR